MVEVIGDDAVYREVAFELFTFRFVERNACYGIQIIINQIGVEGPKRDGFATVIAKLGDLDAGSDHMAQGLIFAFSKPFFGDRQEKTSENAGGNRAGNGE